MGNNFIGNNREKVTIANELFENELASKIFVQSTEMEDSFSARKYQYNIVR